MRHLVRRGVIEVHLQTFTEVITPPRCVNPPGWFIHEFTAITDIAPKIPASAIGTPDHQCAQPKGLRKALLG